MAGRGRAAIGRLVMNQRERMAVLIPRGRGFLLTTLLAADEIRDPDAFFDDLPSGDPSTELLNLAEQLIAMRSGRFDPHVFKDRYQAALKALIEQKLAYGETADRPLAAGPPPAANDDALPPARRSRRRLPQKHRHPPETAGQKPHTEESRGKEEAGGKTQPGFGEIAGISLVIFPQRCRPAA